MAGFDVHQAVTDKIIAQLEAGQAGDWNCPWHRTGGLPRNAATGKAYRGINILSLWCAAQEKGYADARWATYKQWAEIGAQVRKGERSSLVVFFKEAAVVEEGNPEGKRIFVARASYAFNASQVDGAPALPGAPTGPVEDLPERFERFVAATDADITRGGGAAFYQPSQDRIVMPNREAFRSAHGYASTLAHELTHWSGHESRLNRDLTGRFKTRAYAAEELIAELGSAFIMAELGMEAEPHPMHASYLASWIELLREDSKAIFTAASAASRAATYLLPKEQEEVREAA